MFTRGLTHKLNYYIFYYYKYYCDHSMTLPERQRRNHGTRCRTKPQSWCPARLRSFDFGERNGYLKGPTRFRSLDFGKRDGYLKGIAPIDAQ